MMERPIHISPQDLLQAIQFKPGDFAGVALISGQPQRAKASLKYLENPVKNFSTMGYTFWTGEYRSQRVTVGNAGLYAPDTALVTELLCAGGIDTLVRIGSCGALREEMHIGDIVIVEYTLRGDGVSRYYAAEDFIPYATKEISGELFRIFSSNMDTYQGAVWTTDALLKETSEVINPVIEKGAIAVDMISNAFFTVASVYKKKAAAVLVVSDNLITGEIGFNNPKLFDAEHKMIKLALEAIKTLGEK